MIISYYLLIIISIIFILITTYITFIFKRLRIHFRLFILFSNVIYHFIFYILFQVFQFWMIFLSYSDIFIKIGQNLETPYVALFYGQQTICLFYKNALKSILVRRYFGLFQAISETIDKLHIQSIFNRFLQISYISLKYLNM